MFLREPFRKTTIRPKVSKYEHHALMACYVGHQDNACSRVLSVIVRGLTSTNLVFYAEKACESRLHLRRANIRTPLEDLLFVGEFRIDCKIVTGALTVR